MSTERPILFSSAMVRAILDGRKCQTRRVVKLGPSPDAHARAELQTVRSFPAPAYAVFGDSIPDDPAPLTIRSPFGAVGDRLWVREAWNFTSADDIVPGDAVGPVSRWNQVLRVVYREGSASHHPAHPEWGKTLWRPSIHMPRWASRLLLEMTDVRVERLQDISEEDARAEGVDVSGTFIADYCVEVARPRFAVLWDSINGERASWASNPYVWVITFRRVS